MSDQQRLASAQGRFTRRRLLVAAGGGAGTLALGGYALGRVAAGPEPADIVLRPRPAEVELGRRHVSTWTYDGRLPGREIRLRQGRPIRIRVDNALTEPTSIHWHGVRLRNNAADGVPGLTQDAVEPGESYVYEFTPPDAGTFFFHSHFGMQLDRGLYAPLIVEPRREELDYDREAVVLVDDWLDGVSGTPEGRLDALRRAGMAMHGGMRMGARPPSGPFAPLDPSNRVASRHVAMTNAALAGQVDGGDVEYPLHLINGGPPEAPAQIDVRRGERVRLRLINSGADTIYAVFVEDHELRVTHADGLPVRQVTTDAVLMGMGERVDVLLDARRESARLIAVPLGKAGRAVATMRYAGERRRAPAPAARVRIPRRLLTHADLVGAQESEAEPSGDARAVPLDLNMGMGAYRWTIGARPFAHAEMLKLGRDERVRFVLRNRTMMPHPMHLHGHSFRPLTGQTATPPLKDTVVLAPMEELSVQWVADNPGRWAFHCHNAYHQEAGMMRHLEVS